MMEITKEQRREMQKRLSRWGTVIWMRTKQQEKIEALKERRDALCDAYTPLPDGQPHGTTPGDPTANAAVQREKLRAAYDKAIDELCESIDMMLREYVQLDGAILQLPHIQQRIIYARYEVHECSGKMYSRGGDSVYSHQSWADIAERCNVSATTARRLHALAIDALIKNIGQN